MYQIVDNVPVWGEPLQDAVNQAVTVGKRAEAVALMADHHVGYAMPIGGVAAYGEHISPSGAGFDIGCGNKAVLLDAPASEVRPFIKEIMDDVWKHISFGVGRKNAEEVEHQLFEDDPA
jgi:tRNA-splicing ligase RtcB